MALDVYVMPLWRFKVGDFCSPIEIATGIKPKIVQYGEDKQESRGFFGLFRSRSKPKRPSVDDRIAEARGQVEAIRHAVAETNGYSVDWLDEGEVVYSSQSGGFESLRCYARWLDCREQLPEFEPPPDQDYYGHPVWKRDVGKLSCPHLVEHDCFTGYYLPCEFERLAEVEPYLIMGKWPSSRSVGSTTRLLRELDYVQKELKVPDDYQYPEDDPLVRVKAAYLQLRKVASLSDQNRLPIIFWG